MNDLFVVYFEISSKIDEEKTFSDDVLFFLYHEKYYDHDILSNLQKIDIKYNVDQIALMNSDEKTVSMLLLYYDFDVFKKWLSEKKLNIKYEKTFEFENLTYGLPFKINFLTFNFDQILKKISENFSNNYPDIYSTIRNLHKNYHQISETEIKSLLT